MSLTLLVALVIAIGVIVVTILWLRSQRLAERRRTARTAAIAERDQQRSTWARRRQSSGNRTPPSPS